jgi:hypothetical protein
MSYDYLLKNNINLKYINSTIDEIKRKFDDLNEYNTALIYVIILQSKNNNKQSLLKIGYSKSLHQFINYRFPSHLRGFKYNYDLFLYDVYPVIDKEYETLLHKSLKSNNKWNRRIAYVNKDYTVSSTLETYRLCQSILEYISDFADTYFLDAFDISSIKN